MRRIALFAVLSMPLSLRATAQSTTAAASGGTVLPGVNVEASAGRLVVVSGRKRSSTTHVAAPGGSFAVRFTAPAANYHELTQVVLHLHRPSQIAESQLRIRLASASPTGQPADDSLYTPIPLINKQLRSASGRLPVQWPTAAALVPPGGLFIVVEGLGRTPDEFASKLVSNQADQPARLAIAERQQPDRASRLVVHNTLPMLRGGTDAGQQVENWVRNPVTQQWRRLAPDQSAVLVEATFDHNAR